MGSRGIYHDGWMASTFGPRVPWLPGLPPGIHDWTPDNDRWELYHLDQDWSQAHDLAAEMPDKLAQMRELFAIEAARNSVLPIGGGLWVPIFHPELRITPPYREWDFPGDNHPHPRVLRARAGQQEQHRHHRSRPARQRQRSSVRARRFRRWGHLLPRRRIPVLRVQLFHHLPHQDPLDHQTAARPHHDRRRNPLCRTAPRRTARHHAAGRPGGPREGAGAGQRAAAVHRQRLLRHRRLPRLTGVAGLLRQSTVPPSTATSIGSTWHTPDSDPAARQHGLRQKTRHRKRPARSFCHQHPAVNSLTPGATK